MARPVRATHQLVGSVQTALDGLDLLCIADVANGQTDGQSFVAGLRADLADLEVTLADGITPVPWRLPDESCFSQTSGAEKLLVLCKLPESDVIAWRGCTAPTGQDAGAGVVSTATRFYLPLDTLAFDDWTGSWDFYDPGGGASIVANGVLGNAMNCNASGGAAHDATTCTSAFTMNLWYRFDNTATFHRIMSRAVWSRMPAITYNGTRGGRWSIGTTGSTWDESVYWIPPVGQWVMLTLVYAGGMVNWYTNGSLRHSMAATYPEDAQATIFGGHTWGGYTEYPTGAVDEVLWLDDAWGATQIAQYYSMLTAPQAWTTWDGPEESLGAEPAVGVYRPWLMTGGRMR
ncbi:MAG TPA: hypothetical protein DEP45_07655 [Armatimonadetes bacterium]|nr:hypothetical protein [Armatimonadota bacterium]